MKVYINGRFLTQRMTGAQRYALEMTKAIDGLIGSDIISKDIEYFVIAPSNTLYLPELHNIKIIRKGRLCGHAWEQIELPFYTMDGFLINFCNCAPLMKRNQTVTLHDAASSAMPRALSWKFRAWYKFLFIWLGKSLNTIFTVSEFSKKELNKYYSIPLNKIHVTYNGIDHIKRIKEDESIISRKGLNNKNYVLAVSSLNPYKNFPLILEVARYMPDVEFIIAGGSNAKVFKNVGLNVPANARFIGYVSDEELMALYRHASVFVYPSLYEGFGIPPLEAMACGCPVVVSDIEVFHEVYGDSVEYCGCHNISQWVDALTKIVNKKNVSSDLKNYQCCKYIWKEQANRLLESIVFLLFGWC